MYLFKDYLFFKYKFKSPTQIKNVLLRPSYERLSVALFSKLLDIQHKTIPPPRITNTGFLGKAFTN